MDAGRPVFISHHPEACCGHVHIDRRTASTDLSGGGPCRPPSGTCGTVHHLSAWPGDLPRRRFLAWHVLGDLPDLAALCIMRPNVHAVSATRSIGAAHLFIWWCVPSAR